MRLKPFLLDAWLDQYEHEIEFNLAASTGPTWTVNDILSLADDETAPPLPEPQPGLQPPRRRSMTRKTSLPGWLRIEDLTVAEPVRSVTTSAVTNRIRLRFLNGRSQARGNTLPYGPQNPRCG
jgi:hypothetical protein